MSSRIIRGDDRTQKINVLSGGGGRPAGLLPEDHMMTVEKQAFEQGYKEGERIGKQMGERMVETTIKRYDRSIQDLTVAQRSLAEAMEKQTVQLALEIARKIIQREAAMDPDLVAALISAALKRVQGHQSIAVRVNSHDHERVNATIKGAGSTILVKEDSSLERGDFIIDSIQTHVDGRITSQLEAIGRALLDE